MVPVLILIFKRRQSPERLARETVLGLSALNVLLALAVGGIALASFMMPSGARAAALPQEGGQVAPDPLAYIGAAAAVSIGAVGAGYAVANVGSAAVGAIAEKPEVFGRALIFVGLAEGVAIYGLIIAFIILR
ncbi:MAG: H+transporting two-sector ATPase C subunit [Anaerolineae bacterium]|nr:H+transporting two-sector ATPase C subunit [Anaerolineae bacterium]